MKSQVKIDPVKNLLMERSPYKEKESLLFWSILVFMIGFLFMAPFSGSAPYSSSALFNGNVHSFEGSIYSAIIWSAVFLVILTIYYFQHWRLRNVRDLLAVGVWVIPFSYLVSLFPAVSHQLSTNMLLISVLYAVFFLIGSFLAQGRLGASFTQYVIIASGYLIVLFGFMNMFGNVYSKDAVMFDQGLRLTSVFQYANSYAAFLLAILFSSLYLAVSTRKWYWILINSLMLVPIMSSLWLTQSRAALVLLPIIFVLILPFVSLLRQIQMSVYLAISAIVSIAITNQLVLKATPINEKNLAEYTQTGKVAKLISFFDSSSLASWGKLLLISLLFAGLILLINKFVIPWIESKFVHRETSRLVTIIFPIGLVVCGVLGAIFLLGDTGFTKILPDILRTRLESINFQQHSVLERGTFYMDAIKLIKDYPIFGAGGGGWTTLYEKYQNNPYTSRQAHNFLLQYLVEVGVFGFILLIAFLGTLFYFYYKYFFNKPKQEHNPLLIFYIVAISLLIHSLLDFDMSYVYLAALLFLCLGGMSAAIPFKDIQWKNANQILKLRWIFPAVLCVVGVIVLITAVTDTKAGNSYSKAQAALQSQKPYDEITKALDNALQLKSTHPEMVLTKIDLMLQGYNQLKDETYYNKAKSLADKLKKTEPYNRQLLEYQYNMAILKDNKEAALGLVQDGLNTFQWDNQLYERAIDLNTQLGEKHWADALALYNKVLAKEAHLLTLPKGQGQGNPFVVTTQIRASIGQVYFNQKKYSEAIEILKPVVTGTLAAPIDKDITRYYLASLKKLQQDDQPLYNKLIESDATEKEKLDQLLAQ